MKRYILLTIVMISLLSCTEDPDYTTPQRQTRQDHRITVFGNYLYAYEKNNVTIYTLQNDGSIPENKQLLTARNHQKRINSTKSVLFINGDVYDISNPGAPKFYTKSYFFNSCNYVAFNDSLAFITSNNSSECNFYDNTNSLMMYNVKNMINRDRNPNPKLDTLISMVNPKGIGAKDKNVYVCDEELLVYEVQDSSANLDLIQTIPIDAQDVFTLENHFIVRGTDAIYQYSYAKDNQEINLLSKID